VKRLLPGTLLLVACAGAVDPPAPVRDAAVAPIDPTVRKVEAGEACAMQSARAERGVDKQVDVIVIVDNSGSMTDEIVAIRENLDTNFAAILRASGVDYRVILLSRYGRESTNLCIEPPLAGAPCNAGLAATNGERYFHYDVVIDSLNSWCVVLDTLDQPDDSGRAPDGWRAWLRPAAEKAFVVITDDSVACTAGEGENAMTFGGTRVDPFEDALSFHQALIASGPELFGEPPMTRYRWHSIVGLGPRNDPSTPWFPHEEVNTERCDTAATVGESYQALSIVTDALRYPVCEGRGFDAVFQVLARSVVETAKVDCVFEIPEAPAGQALDRASVRVEYEPGDGGKTQTFEQQENAKDCDDGSFFIRDDRIELCPDVCDIVEADSDAEVNVLYACVVVPD
jgi:hypothetical protein